MATENRSRRLSYRVRRTCGPHLDALVRRLGHQSHRIRRTEYVGTVERPIDDLEAGLREGGFRWDPFSLYHYTPAGTATDGSWVYRSSPFADRQLHVILFAQSPDRIDVYAHNEFNWLRHPRKHFREADVRREEGAEQMRRALDRLGIDHDREPWLIRKAIHVLERVLEGPLGDGIPTA